VISYLTIVSCERLGGYLDEGCLTIPCSVGGCKSRDPAEGGTGTAFLLADYINIDYQMAESPSTPLRTGPEGRADRNEPGCQRRQRKPPGPRPVCTVSNFAAEDRTIYI